MRSLKTSAFFQSLIHHFLILALIFLAIPSFGQTIIKSPIFAASNTYEFSVDHTGDPNTTTGLNYFWRFSDNTYSYSNKPVRYFPGPIGDVHVEITDIIYDDDPPPKMVINEPTPNTQGVAYSSIIPLPAPSTYEMIWSRNAVLGHPITYVLKVTNNCNEGDPSSPENLSGEVYFEYDHKKLFPIDGSFLSPVNLPYLTSAAADYIPFNTYTTNVTYSFTSDPTGIVQSPGPCAGGAGDPSEITRMEWDISGLPDGESRNIYITFLVSNDPSIDNSPLYICSGFTNDDENSECAGGGMIQQGGQSIADSHDPNVDMVNVPFICPDNYPTELEYTIVFQNTGNAATDKVEVTVWMDRIFDPNNVQYIGSSSAVKTGSVIHNPGQGKFNAGQKTYTWLLEPAILNGTGEFGYPDSILEASTKGFVKFKVQIPPGPLNACSAIFSRASILFDCNPAVYTETTITRVGKINTDSTAACRCIPCEEIIENFDANISGQAETFDPSRQKLNRFPPTWNQSFNNTFDWGDPKFYTPANTHKGWPSFITYAADKLQGKRYLLTTQMEPCLLQTEVVSINPNSANPCNFDVSLRVVNGDPANTYTWQGCATTSGSDTFTISNLVAGSYTKGVRDELGCEGWIDFDLIPLSAYDESNDCDGKIEIIGGQTPYTVQWPGGNAQPYDPTASVNLSSYQNPINVTITDAGGCNIVLNVKKANCGPGTGWGWGNWGLIAVGVIAIGFLLLRFFRP